jgi:hypothetical protein
MVCQPVRVSGANRQAETDKIKEQPEGRLLFDSRRILQNLNKRSGGLLVRVFV